MDQLSKKSTEFQAYLAKFKDENGKPPDPFKVAVFVQVYCDMYIASLPS